ESEFRIGAVPPIICLFVCWFFPCVSLMRRTRVLGERSLYIVATSSVIFALFLLHILCLRHISDGIRRYFKPDFEKWTDYNSWAAAINE
ncbi:hypothetical protein PMAYCL1PPCAC_28322, partial [Pristionchus mayeri]